jgi:TrpR-related protein YerC/YecD
MTQRIMAAKMLISGATYESVIKETNVSSATLSRVSRCVKNGKGYKKFIDISK